MVAKTLEGLLLIRKQDDRSRAQGVATKFLIDGLDARRKRPQDGGEQDAIVRRGGFGSRSAQVAVGGTDIHTARAATDGGL